MEPTDRRRERTVHHLLGPTSLQLTPYRPWEIQLARPTPDTHIKGWAFTAAALTTPSDDVRGMKSNEGKR